MWRIACRKALPRSQVRLTRFLSEMLRVIREFKKPDRSYFPLLRATCNPSHSTPFLKQVLYLSIEPVGGFSMRSSYCIILFNIILYYVKLPFEHQMLSGTCCTSRLESEINIPSRPGARRGPAGGLPRALDGT